MDTAELPFGRFVRKVRRDRDMTQEELAVYLGVTRDRIASIETGKTSDVRGFRALFCERMGIPEKQWESMPPKAAAYPLEEAGRTELPDKPFGELMREVRKAKGMTQRELAELLGVEQPSISHIESGDSNPSKPLKKLFYEKMGIQEPQASGLSAPHTPRSAAGPVLLDEIKAAHKELGRPLSEIELAAWSAAKEEELVAESSLLREALELRTKRELLAAAKASRQRWEAKAHGK